MLMNMNVHRTVIASSLIPNKSGDHVKTDKKDAIKLACLHRAGELVSVRSVSDDSDVNWTRTPISTFPIHFVEMRYPILFRRWSPTPVRTGLIDDC